MPRFLDCFRAPVTFLLTGYWPAFLLVLGLLPQTAHAKSVHPSRRRIILALLAGLLFLPTTAGAVTATLSVPATDYNGTFTVSWSVNTTNGGYSTLQQRLNGGAWTTIYGVGALGSQSHTVTVSESGTYDYQVKYAYYAGPYPTHGSTAIKTTVVTLKPSSPPNVSVSAVSACTTSLTVSWSSGVGYPSGATHYYDLQESVNSGSTWNPIGTRTGTQLTSWSRNLVFDSFTYQYRVRGYFTLNGDTSHKTGWTTKTVSKPWCPPGTPGTPTLSQPTPTSSTNVSVSWSAPTSGGTVQGYRLELRDATASAWTAIYTGSGTSYADAGEKTRGQNYEYRVLAYNGVNGSWSTTQSVYVPYAPPVAPNLDDNIGGAVGYNGVYTINWISNGGVVEGFDVEAIETANATPQTADWPGTAVIPNNGPQSASYDQPTNFSGAIRYYHYRARAVNRDAQSPWVELSVAVNFYPTPGAVDIFEQVGLATAAGNYTLRWEKPTGVEEVTHYKLDRLDTPAVEYPAITDVDTQAEYTQSLSGGVSGQSYHHAIEACFQPNEPGAEEACSGYTGTLAVYIPYPVPNTPADLTGPDGSLDGSFQINWSPAVGGVLDHYELEETVNGNSNIINAGIATEFSRSGANGHYEFRVRACSPDADGPLTPVQACSSWSAKIAFNAFTTPAEFEYNLNDASFLPNLGDGDFVAITQGNAEVNNGAAQYTLPITLPPAINGLKPELALSYNSRGGNGMLGVGWSLSGFSTIARCSATYATEGSEAQDANPKYTSEDRLCLDGKKLEIASSASPASNSVYWASGAEYRTEIDSFAKIQAFGTHNGAHQYFKVWTKGGRILTYGREEVSQNSRIYAPGQATGPVSIWVLDKVEDRYGNEYTIHYQRNTADGDYYPTHINFSPDASVVFSYINRDADSAGYRSDMPYGYDKGRFHKHPKLLDKITTYIGVTSSSSPTAGTPVREYDINYQRSATTHRYLVSDITDCGFESGSRVCAEPLTFEWQAGELGFESQPSPLQSCSGDSIEMVDQMGDVDNDGYVDILVYGRIHWGTPEKCFIRSGDWTHQGLDGWSWSVGPLLRTPRGLAKVVTREHSEQGAATWYEMGIVEYDRAGQTMVFQPLTRPASPRVVIGDFNKDGLHDMLYYAHDKGWMSWLQHAGNPVSFTGSVQLASLFSTEPGFTDFNGDGLADYLASYKAYRNTGSGHFEYAFDLPVSDSTAQQVFIPMYGTNTYMTFPVTQHRSTLDFNGDGQADLAWHRIPEGQSEGVWYVKFNTEDGFSSQIDTGISSGPQTNQHTLAYDWNKDGRDDLIVCCMPGYTGWNVLLATYNNGQPAFSIVEDDPFNGILDYLTEDEHPNSTPQVLPGDFNNDGLIDIYQPGNWLNDFQAKVWYAKQQQPDLLKTVTNGLGAQVKLEYSPLVQDDNNGNPLYMPGQKPVFPQQHAPRSMQVVERLSVSNGQEGYHHRYFNYTGAKEHAQGHGFLGFEKIVVTDASLNTVTTSTYRQDFPFFGQIASFEIKDGDDKLISITDNHYAVHAQNARFPYPDYSIQQQYGLTTTSSSNSLSVTKTENTFDAYGNLTDQITTIGTGLSGSTVTGVQRIVTVDNTVTNNTLDWLIGFIETQTQQTTEAGGVNPRSVTTEFDPEPGTLDVAVRRDFIGTPVWKTTTTTRNANGVVTEVAVEASDIDNGTAATRTTTWSNFSDLIYPQMQTNAKGHATTLGYDLRFGAIDSETGPNSLTTTREYDALGRLIQETASDGTTTRIVFYRCVNAPVTCPVDAAYLTAMEITHSAMPGQLGAPLTIVYYDKLQREVRTETYSLDSTVIKVDTVYYMDGRLHKISEPYTASTTNNWTVYANYDALNRAHEIAKADNGNVHYDYFKEGALQKTVETVTVLTPNGSRTQTTTRYTNALGQVEQVLDDEQTSVDYTYDTQGNLKTTTVNNNAATAVTIIYNVAGNKTYIDDPDAGRIDFEYNGFGELRHQIWQKNTAAAKSITYTYDVLGRKTGRIDTPVAGSPVSYTWIWDTAKKGLLDSRSGNGFTESYAYDSQLRLVTQTTSIIGLGSRAFSYTYDAFSRAATVTYPDGLKVEHQYHATGLQAQTRDVTDPLNPQILWTLGEDSNGRGNLYQQRFGNGVITLTESDSASGRVSRIQTGWPKAGGLTGFTGNIQDLAYEFDTLGNLYERTTGRTDANGTMEEYTVEMFTYDDLNRLKTSDTNWLAIGMRNRNYSYDALGNLTYRSDIGTLTYDQSNSAGVHAVTTANGQSYQYDAYGNMVQRGADTLDYDVFNKPMRIGSTYFSYGPDRARFKQVNGNRTTYYINGGAYEEIIEGGVTTIKSYVGGYLVRSTKAGEASLTYLHKDYLGSVEAMTDQWGNLIDRMSFDPWGERQYADWETGNPTGGDPNYYDTTRGYTGHEQLDQLGLIHMNGRVYDPTLGRFLSPDLLVQAPYNTQSFNRYSYVFNNPLSLVDPSGYHGTDPECQGCIVWGPLGSAGMPNGADMAAAQHFQRSTPLTGNIIFGSYEKTQILWGNIKQAIVEWPEGISVIRDRLSEAYRDMRPSDVNRVALGAFLDNLNYSQILANRLSLVGFGFVRHVANSALRFVQRSAVGDVTRGALDSRVEAVHGVLDPIAQTRRTTVGLDTVEGTRIIAAGGRDLNPAQRAALIQGETAASLPGAHAEVTALEHAAANGLTPAQMAVSRPICSACATFIEQSGGSLTSPTTVEWP